MSPVNYSSLRALQSETRYARAQTKVHVPLNRQRQLPEAVPGCSLSRTNLAPAARAFIFPNATSAGRYFMPQSDAAMRRSAPTNGKARLIRAATNSAVSTSLVERSSTPRIIVFPGSFARIAQSSFDCAVSIEIWCTGESDRERVYYG